MSDTSDTKAGAMAEGLTPFEFALAGVAPAGSSSSPSLAVIEDMRSVASEVSDAPIALPGLQEFLETGGPRSRFNPQLRRRRRPSNGAFIDITPTELTGAPASNGSGLDSSPESPTEGVLEGISAEIDLEQPAAEAPAGSQVEPEQPDPVEAELLGVDTAETPLDVGPDDKSGLGHQEAEIEATSGANALLAQGLSDDRATQPELETIGDDFEGDQTLGVFANGDGSEPVLEAPEESMAGPVVASSALSLVEDEPAPPADGVAAAITVPRSREADGRFSAQPGSLLGAGSDDESDRPPVPLFAAPPVAAEASRLKGSVLALVGTAAAAAALVAGGLWWFTNGLGTISTEDGPEVAAPPVEDDPADDETDRSTGDAGDDTDDPEDGDPDADQVEQGSSSTRPGSSSLLVPSTSTTTGPSTSIAPTSPTSPTTPSTESTVESSTTTASTTTTTAPSTTIETTTTQPPPTTPPPTTPTTVQAGYIGDQIYLGDWGGPGLANVRVRLLIDDDGNGTGDREVAQRTTGSDGRYFFTPLPGCYEVRFEAPAGYEIDERHRVQRLCLTSGQIAPRVDAIVRQLTAAAPSGCKVEPRGNEFYRGIEVYELNGTWDEYIFYGSSGQVIARTVDMGPPDDVEGRTNHEWHAQANGFNHRRVYSVSAVRNGIESSSVTCTRE